MLEFPSIRRLLCDLFITFILVFLLADLFRRVLDLDDFNTEKIFLICLVILSISIGHHLLCISNNFFWKFAFLLPNDVYYYIFAKKKQNLYDNLEIELDKSINFILSNPLPFQPGASHGDEIFQKNIKIRAYQIVLKILKSMPGSKLLKYEIEDSDSIDIILLLQKKDKTKLKIVNGENYYISQGQYGNQCNEFGLYFLYLLFSKNVILLLMRSILLIFIFMAILWQNPPLMVVADPLQIQENWTQDEISDIIISAKNIGCNLINVSLETESFDEKLINSYWISKPKEKNETFLSNDVHFIRLMVNGKCPPGEYRGSIKITAKANRIIVPNLSSWRFLDQLPLNTPITDTTYTKKLVDVPYLIRITPRLNATTGLANWTSQQKT